LTKRVQSRGCNREGRGTLAERLVYREKTKKGGRCTALDSNYRNNLRSVRQNSELEKEPTMAKRVYEYGGVELEYNLKKKLQTDVAKPIDDRPKKKQRWPTDVARAKGGDNPKNGSLLG